MGDPSNILLRNCDIPSQPIIDPVWRGSLRFCNEKFRIVPGIAAHLSNKACSEVRKLAHLLPPVLRLEFLPRPGLWPTSFSRSPPTESNIALYFFPAYRRDKQIYESLRDYVISKDFAMKAMVDNIELLVFTSLQLPLKHQRFQGQIYMWGVFRGKQPSPPHQIYLLAENSSFECDVPLTPANDAGTRKDVCDTQSPLGPLNNNANSQRIKRMNSTLTISRDSNIILRQCKKRMVDTYPTTSPIYPKRKIASAKGLQSGSPKQEMLEHHVAIPEPVQLGNRASLIEPIPLGNQITPAVPLLPIQQFSEQPPGPSTRPQAVLFEGIPDTIVPYAIPFATSTFTTPASDVQETTAFEFQDVLPDIMPQDDNGEGEKKTSSHTQGGSQRVGTSVLHMVSAVDESVSLDETGSIDSSAEQVDKFFVKPGLAPILQAIIEKHGDIARNCPLISSRMLTPALERVCIAVQDLQALQFNDLQVCHLESLYSAIIDAEVIKLDVEWLRNQHDDLTEAMDMINHCKKQNDIRAKIIKENECTKKTLDIKRDEMMKLQSEIHSLESDLAVIVADTTNLKSTMNNLKSDLNALARESPMNGFL